MSMHGEDETCVPTHDEDHESADRLVAATDDRKLWRFGHGPFPGGLVHRFELAPDDPHLELEFDDRGDAYLRVPARWAASLADLIDLAAQVGSLSAQVVSLSARVAALEANR